MKTEYQDSRIETANALHPAVLFYHMDLFPLSHRLGHDPVQLCFRYHRPMALGAGSLL